MGCVFVEVLKRTAMFCTLLYLSGRETMKQGPLFVQDAERGDTPARELGVGTVLL